MARAPAGAPSSSVTTRDTEAALRVATWLGGLRALSVRGKLAPMTYRENEPTFQPVVVAFGDHVIGMHPTTGARLWRYQFGSAIRIRLALAGEVLYALGGTQLVCLQLHDGAVIGQVTTRTRSTAPTLLATHDRILVASHGEVQCFSSDGRLLWEDQYQGMGMGEVALAYAGIVAQADSSS